jgi:hypothetical protein
MDVGIFKVVPNEFMATHLFGSTAHSVFSNCKVED